MDYKVRENLESIPPMLFVSTISYSQEAIDFAERNNIELWDYNDIYDITHIFTLENFKNILQRE